MKKEDNSGKEINEIIGESVWLEPCAFCFRVATVIRKQEHLCQAHAEAQDWIEESKKTTFKLEIIKEEK